MIDTGGFTAGRKIFEGQSVIFYKAVREADGVPVILKLLKTKLADEDKLSFFNSEIEGTNKLNHAGILKPLDISRYRHEPVLVLEDFNGEVLENISRNGRTSIELFLKIAIKLVDIVACIHNSNMIHSRIKPDSIFVDVENDVVMLTGLGDNSETAMDGQIQHEWIGNRYDAAYISPEQTGRVNCKPDHRTDFYSIGIVFYVMLTGVLPFAYKDYTEIIYSHLASEAIPVSQHNPDVPEVLTAIIGKLMQKKVENRYQTAEGLKRDLEECMRRLEFRDNRYEIKAFPIGKGDVSGELYLPQKVLGRENEVKELLTAFEEVRKSGIPRLVLVSGYSGIGKTTLVNEICPFIKSAGGSFLEGKYDQYKKNTPYSSLIQAFDIFFDEILVQGKDGVSEWRDRFVNVLGINAGIITNIFPKLGKVIGTHKQAEAMSLLEAQNRFNTAITGFLQTAAAKEHPLVVFLDDLQWADGSSIRLLEFILSGIENIYILFVGAYRNNEVDQSHPLQELINSLSGHHDNAVEIIKLKPLGFEQVRELMEEMLHYSSEETDILTRLCCEKTEGNPFFLHQFIKSIKDEGVISYNSKEKKWKINMERVLEHDTTGGITDLIVQKIERLSEYTVEVLKIAACINNTFEADTISKALNVSYESVKAALGEAFREGLIVPRDYAPDRYCFLHDRVQQVVYSQADEEQKLDFHYRIGKQLLEENPEFEEAESLFEITEHLNLAESIMGAKDEMHMIARLNLESGKRAKNCSAYDRALDYFMKGMEVIGDDSWDNQYELTRELYTEAAGVAYICGRYELMNRFGDVVLDRSKALIDKAKIYEIRVEYLTVGNKLGEAIETARQTLKFLGINIPAKPTGLDIAAKYLKIRFALIGRTFNNLRNMPEMKDETYLTIMRILTSAGIAAYTYSEPVMLMLTLNVVHISLEHGTAPLTPVAYAGYGHFLCAYLKKREQGYRFGKLAIDLQSAMESKAYECKTNLLFEILIRHNKEHIRNTLNGFPDNHLKGLNSGDLTSAGHIMMQHFVYAYLSGRELLSIRKEMDYYKGDMQRTGNRTAISVCMMYLQGIENLLEGFKRPWELRGQYFNEEEELPHYKAVNDRTVIFNSYFNKMLLSYIFGHYEEALKYLEIVKEYYDGAIGTYCIPVYNFYGALIHLKMLSGASLKKDKYTHKRKVDTYLREVRSYFKDAPENNENKYFLIRAMQAHVSGNDDQAMRYCNESIQAAGKYGFLQEEALANELAAKIAYSAGKEEKSKSYVKAAVYCYSKWGCHLKVEMLQAEYADSISPQLLDVESIVRASQAISEEIVIQELMKKMIRIVLQNAGASKVLFIMETDGELYIEAEGTADDKEIKIIKGAAVKGNTQVSEKLLNYVINTGESIVLNSETDIERFAGEKFGHSKGARSLICMPVESKHNLVGLLYLENNLIDGAFTGQHMLVLKVLVSQLAISMENARLYQNVEKMVDERTEQLRIKNYELECANSKLINANRIKDGFLANMSHEMRTPLHGVIGLAGMMQKGSLDPEQRKTVNSIIFSARSLLKIINEILDFSKIEANRMELEERDFELNQLIRELLPPFTQAAEEKGIALSCRVQPEMVKTLRGDSHRIKQIISNLLSNAVKFTERGGVEFEVSVAESREMNAVMKVSVKDSGIGIPPEKLSQIFRDFVQADSSTTRKFGGTGLGLSIAKKLAEMMNGTISAESIPGKGSTFTCSIRLGMSEGNGDSGISGVRLDAYSWGKEPLKLKVLVAEDNAISCKYIKALLEYGGCSVTLASNGMEALEKLKSDAFDCILMDKNMPDLDGMATARMIRRIEAGTGRHIPIIALTASAIVGDREKLLSSGMDYYLSKPLNEKQLWEILKAVKGEAAMELQGEESDETVEYELIDSKIFFKEAELFGEEVMLEIISEFLKGYGDVMLKIEAYIGKADFISLEKEVHKFAGTVSIFHCSSFASLLKRVERTAARKDRDSLADQYPVIKDGTIRLVHELEGVREHLLNKKGL